MPPVALCKKDLWARVQEWCRINLKEGLVRLHGFFLLEKGGYRVGVLVNANHGRRHEFTIAGVPVGRLYKNEDKSVSQETIREHSFSPISKNLPASKAAG